MYDYVIVTHLPAFYKINLYNKLSETMNIYVVFISNNTAEKRSSDFISIDNINFEYTFLSSSALQNRNVLSTIYFLSRIIFSTNYKRLIISGWDLPEFWIAALLSPSKKNCLALESTVFESNTNGLKGYVKKIFLSMISTVLASGNLHVKLLEKLMFKKKIITTNGVGIINKPEVNIAHKAFERKFVFIGRLTKVKNLKLLISVFNKLDGYQLTIVGEGEDKESLMKDAKSNIMFMDSIKNDALKSIFDDNDVLILPSVSEPWGLVVEEAMYFGMPVIVSKNCGASELVSDGINGFIVDPHSHESIQKAIVGINDENFASFSHNVSKKLIELKDKEQVNAYVI